MSNVESTPKPIPPATRTPTLTPYQRQCTDRVQAFTSFVHQEYNIDPIHSRLILSILVPSPHASIWCIFETQRTPFWKHLDFAMRALGMSPITNIAGIRTNKMSPWYSHTYVMEWMERWRHEPKILIDTQRTEGPRAYRTGLAAVHGYWTLMPECIKAKVADEMLKMPREGADEEMVRLLRMALDLNGRTVFPTHIQPTPVLNELIHAVPKLNTELTDGETFYSSMCLLPSAHAALYGRTNSELIDLDYYNLMECLRGSVRRPLMDLFKQFGGNSNPYMTYVLVSDVARNLCLTEDVTKRWVAELVKDKVLIKEFFRKKANARRYTTKFMYKLSPLGITGFNLVSLRKIRWWREDDVHEWMEKEIERRGTRGKNVGN